MSLIDLTNFSEHPTQASWLVFRYATTEQAQAMIDLLNKEQIGSESDLIEGPPFMVGVHKRYFTRAEKLNYFALGQSRKPFIASAFWRWFLVVFFFTIMTIALIGYFKSI